MSTILTIVIAALLIGFGVLGCFVAKIPGPLLSWLGLVVIHLSLGTPIDWWLLWIVLPAIIVLSMIFTAKVAPKLAAKVHEFGKAGKWGTFVGSMITLLLAVGDKPLWLVITCLFVLPYIFATLFELISVRKPVEAVKRGGGSYVLYLMTTLIKLLIVYLCFYFAFQNSFGDAEDAAEAARKNPSYTSIGMRTLAVNEKSETSEESFAPKSSKKSMEADETYVGNHNANEYYDDLVEEDVAEPETSTALRHSYDGKVAGSKCTFDLVFTPMGDAKMSVNGSYYYNKVKSSIILKGAYDKRSQCLTLTEFDDNGQPCSTMEMFGNVSSGLSGTFSRPDGKTFAIEITRK